MDRRQTCEEVHIGERKDSECSGVDSLNNASYSFCVTTKKELSVPLMVYLGNS